MIRTPDIFRDAVVSRVLRWMVYEGDVPAANFKGKHIELGGTVHSTHAFDRYFEGLISSFTPAAGSYGILQRDGFGREGRVRWVGSAGDTFQDRASNWLQRVAVAVPMPTMRLEAAFFLCRKSSHGDLRNALVERAWCTAIRRSLVDTLPPRSHLLRRLTNTEIEDWHGFCEARAVETGGERAEQWLSAVRINIAHREREYWASRPRVRSA